jgi:hypothetical protein
MINCAAQTFVSKKKQSCEAAMVARVILQMYIGTHTHTHTHTRNRELSMRVCLIESLMIIQSG